MFQRIKIKPDKGAVLGGLVLFFCLFSNSAPAQNLPDLRVEDIKFYCPGSPERPANEIAPTPGKAVVCKAILKNAGSVNTGRFNVRWFVDGIQKSYGSHAGLAPLALSSGNVRFHWVPARGVHTLKFVADPDNRIRESNEANNAFERNLSLQPVTPPPVTPRPAPTPAPVTTPPATSKQTAVDKVVKYFKGEVTKTEAVNTVVNYFANPAPPAPPPVTPAPPAPPPATPMQRPPPAATLPPTPIPTVTRVLPPVTPLPVTPRPAPTPAGVTTSTPASLPLSSIPLPTPKEIAVDKVLKYFQGEITKPEAVRAVLDYFAASASGPAPAPPVTPAPRPLPPAERPAPIIIITSPANGKVFDTDQVILEGTVDGVAFSENRILAQEGANILTKAAVNSSGKTSFASVTVYLRPAGEIIGPAGGSVISSDGKVKVIIPAGALSESRRINVSAINSQTFQGTTPEGRSLLSLVECKPYGLVFSRPVSLIYALNSAEVPGTSVELGLYDKILGKIIPTGQASVVPVDGYTLNFSLTHFSTYAALKGMVSSGLPIGGGVKIPLPDMFTGAFSSSVPITVPPGRKGMQPSLALTYRSSNPNSWVGLGFSLNPGYIARSTRLGPAKYIDTQDTFYFVSDAGSTELVWLIDNLYQAKIESSFTKFFKEPDDSWKAVARDGSILRFGQGAEAKEGSSQGTFSWYLTRAIDTNGNYIQYQYLKDEGKAYLARIDYTGNEAVSLSPANSVEFLLEPRDDIGSSYITSSRIATGKRLKEIQVKAGYDLIWRYELEYNYSQDTNRSLLKSVKQFGADGKSLPTQTMEYQKAK